MILNQQVLEQVILKHNILHNMPTSRSIYKLKRTFKNLFKFETNGYAVLENFLPVEKCKLLQEECERIIDSNNFVEEVNKISVFDANEGDEGSARVNTLLLS
jgi:hypothetical protein